jgi:hypothetical protein
MFIDYVKKIEKYLNKDSLLVFQDEFLKKTFVKNLQKNFCFSQASYISLEELKDQVFFENKIILNGLKRKVVFCNSLSKKTLSFFLLKDFFEAQTFANKFFAFFEEMQESMIDKLEANFFKTTSSSFRQALWQEKQYEYLINVKNDYFLYLEKTEYADKLFLNTLNIESLAYQKKNLIFIRNEEPSKRDKFVLNKLKNSMKVLDILVETEGTELEQLDIYRCSNNFSQIVHCAKRVSKDSYDLIIDLTNNAAQYTDILSENYFNTRYIKKFSFAKIISFLKCLEILSKEFSNNKLNGFRLEEVYSNSYFRSYYDISDQKLNNIRKELSENVIFFSLNFLEDFLIKDLIKIKDIRTILDLESFVDSIQLEKLQDAYNDTIIDKFFGQLFVMKSAFKDFDFDCFQIKGRDWLRLFRNNCEKLNIEYFMVSQEENKLRIIDYNNAWFLENKNIVFLNANQNVLSIASSKNILFTEQQKRILSLPCNEDALKKKEKRFLNFCIRNNNISIYCIEDNKGENQASSLVEKLINKYSCKNIVKQHYVEEDIFYNQYISLFAGKNNYKKIEKNDSLIPLDLKFIQHNISLSFSSFQSLKACPLKYYLDYIIKLKRNNIEETLDVKPNVLGNLVHNIFAEIFKKIRGNIDKDYLFNNIISKTDKTLIVQKNLEALSSSLPKVYQQQYAFEYIAPVIVQSIDNLLRLVEQKCSFKDVNKILIEKESIKTEHHKVLEKGINENALVVYINGVPDLRIENKNSKIIIIDYKTGSTLHKLQLSFYEELFYSDVRESYLIDKAFYRVFEQVFEFVSKENVSEKIEEVIDGLLNKNKYEFALTTESCLYCNHEGICRKNG